MIPVFGLTQLPGVVVSKQPGDALEPAHVRVGLVRKCENTLYLLGFGLRVVIPVDKALVLMPGANREIQVGPVDGDP